MVHSFYVGYIVDEVKDEDKHRELGIPILSEIYKGQKNKKGWKVICL